MSPCGMEMAGVTEMEEAEDMTVVEIMIGVKDMTNDIREERRASSQRRLDEGITWRLVKEATR